MSKEAITRVFHGEHRGVKLLIEQIDEAEVEEQIIAVAVEKQDESFIFVPIPVLLCSEEIKAVPFRLFRFVLSLLSFGLRII